MISRISSVTSHTASLSPTLDSLSGVGLAGAAELIVDMGAAILYHWIALLNGFSQTPPASGRFAVRSLFLPSYLACQIGYNPAAP